LELNDVDTAANQSDEWELGSDDDCASMLADDGGGND